MKEYCTICGSFHELTTAGCPTMTENISASTNNIKFGYTRANLDKAVADERVKWEKIIDLVIEDKYEPDKWPEEVRDRMPITLRESIRNRGKNHDNSN